ncbi:unnamed protein product [Brassica napus]|uniref:(rape) hypothetical protein n=1 Tax=Brassica napus TaxID=3708 RepID=A0A816XWQ3_BRANA|nr:unnamed protein product [Brassica napus]
MFTLFSCVVYISQPCRLHNSAIPQTYPKIKKCLDNSAKKRQRRKEDCRRRKESVEEDWSSPSSRILSSSPSILADVVLVTVSQIHFFQSPSSP